MTRSLSQRRSLWVGAALLMITMALVLVQPYGWLLALALLLGLALTTLRLAPATSLRAPRRSAARATPLLGMEQRQIVLEDGSARNARVVLSDQEGLTFALTREGYVLVNGEGQVIHSLRPLD